MNHRLIWHSTIVWLGLFVLAFVNGALREFVMKKLIGIHEPLAHQLSCITGAALWTWLVWVTWRFLGITTTAEALAVGAGWFVATLFTETFLINRLMGKMSWEQIFQTYNVAQGEFWGLVLIYVSLIPFILFKVKTNLRV